MLVALESFEDSDLGPRRGRETSVLQILQLGARVAATCQAEGNGRGSALAGQPSDFGLPSPEQFVGTVAG